MKVDQDIDLAEKNACDYLRELLREPPVDPSREESIEIEVVRRCVATVCFEGERVRDREQQKPP